MACVAALQLAPNAKVLPALRRGNIVGAIEMGLVPGEGGMHAMEIAKAAPSGKIECSCCSAATRSPTSPTPIWLGG